MERLIKAAQSKIIRMPDGKVYTLNRKQRRRAHIYNRDLKPMGAEHGN